MEEGSTLFEALYSLKEQDLSAVLERMKKVVSPAGTHAHMNQVLTKAISHPGKMLRLLLVLLSADAYPEEAREELLCAAAAAELVHIASLIHDDIIDQAEVRRGYPSVQAEYGIPTAICAGDYLLIKAFAYLNDLGYSSTARDLMNAALKVCEGELIQDSHQFDTSVSEEAYLDSIRGKTAAAFAECCAIGCRIAGRPEHIRQALRSYGELLGMMFQIRDDILDWTKGSISLKKTPNGDFKNGIYTLPVIYALSREPYSTCLKRFVNTHSIDQKDFEEISKIVRESGGIEYAKERLDDFAVKALEALDDIPKTRYNRYFEDLVRIIRNSVTN